jgi:anti-anti-sigma regulatory factor
MATVKLLEETIAELMVPGRPIVIDMAALNYIDSSGLACWSGSISSRESGS